MLYAYCDIKVKIFYLVSNILYIFLKKNSFFCRNLGLGSKKVDWDYGWKEGGFKGRVINAKRRQSWDLFVFCVVGGRLFLSFF